MIIVKDFNWSQSEESIFIQVPLKNAAISADVLTFENFIKIYANPFYFEAFLLHDIIEDESRCQITNDEVSFYLKKAEPIPWKFLQRDFSSKTEKIEVKKEILERIQEKSKEKLNIKLQQKDKIKRSEVENSVAKDAEVRDIIEKVQKLAIQQELSKLQKIQEIPKKVCPTVKVAPTAKLLLEIPVVRNSGVIMIQFSQRNFMTPKRESQDPAEQEWLLKQAEARKATGFVAEDLRPEERVPMYLKKKGDEFFQQKNYLAAISAYTTGIKLASKCYELYLNRSAAHFVQKNYQRCAEDCSMALELLKPPVASNQKARTQSLARRGAALLKLGFIRQAYDEFIAAVKLDPFDEVLRHDAEMLRSKLESLEVDGDE